MPAAPAASLVQAALGLELGATDAGAGNRISIDGLTLAPAADGAFTLTLRQLEAASLRLASGPLVLELGRVVLQDIQGQLRMDQGTPRLARLEAARGELAAIKLHGPVLLPAAPAAGSHATPETGGTWLLAPLATAQGTVRAEIVDAHLMFDADVTVPIRAGQVEFGDATVEHVGPDSRMGVSRLGLYVDAPNGRSYLYQFPATPIAGVEFERRGALLGPFVTDRGRLQLQAFAEGMLRQGRGQGLGFTEQSRLLFDRTAVSGEVQLGDGRFEAPGVHAELAGRAEGRNLVRLHSEAVGRGLNVEVPTLSVRQAALTTGGLQLGCETLTAALVLRVVSEGGQLRFAFEMASAQLAGVRIAPNALQNAS
jgi:hypothetical protein